VKNNASWLLVAVTTLFGCAHTADPIASYKIDDPTDRDAIYDLPTILETTRNIANIEEWFRLAETHQLVGKGIDDAIRVYGQHYLISLHRGRKGPRMYYHLAGTRSWGVFGVVVLDRDLRVREIKIDPAN